MAITRVWIEDGCVSCGLSESNCPEVFKVKDKGSTVIEGDLPVISGQLIKPHSFSRSLQD